MDYIIKHGVCCDNLDEETIEGNTLESALDKYISENFEINSSCEIETKDEKGKVRYFYLQKSIRCDVWEQDTPPK